MLLMELASDLSRLKGEICNIFTVLIHRMTMIGQQGLTLQTACSPLKFHFQFKMSGFARQFYVN